MTHPIKFRAWEKPTKKMRIPFVVGAPCKSENRLYVIMQFTGLLDKNDKEIYEGDIILLGCCGGSYKSRVFFNNASFLIEGEHWTQYKRLGEFTTKIDCEVIGNQFENPELLEKKPC